MSDKTLALFLKPYSTVIITGGSSGIGKALLTILSRVKPNLFICNLSRTKPANNMQGVGRVHIECDLSCRMQTARAAEQVLQWASAQEGKVLLINNSGCGQYGSATQLTREAQLQMLDLNVCAVVDLTSRMLPLLIERKGALINVASTAAFQPTPYLAAYGASKAFVLNWSLALSYELAKEDVIVMALCPGPTHSEFFLRAGFKRSPVSPILGASPEQVAMSCLRAVARKRSFIVCGWLNRCMTWIARRSPLKVLTTASGKTMEHLRKLD